MTDQPLHQPSDGADASGVGRRAFLGAGAGVLATAAMVGTGTILDPLGAAAGPVDRPLGAARSRATRLAPPGRLVVVFLRGGMDGLSAVAPVADPLYHSLRPTIAVPEAKALELDTTFGMHPALAPLLPLYTAKRLAVVHAVGNPAASRSHFDAQSLMEQGDDSNAADGLDWLGRHLATKPGSPGGASRAAALSANLTPSLRGYDALVVRSLDAYGLNGLAALGKQALASFHAGSRTIQVRGTEALGSVDAVAALDGTPVPGGSGTGAAAFGDAVALLAGGLGIEVVTVDLGGWDTHDNMGTVDSGDMRTLLAGLGANLAAFQAALDSAGLSDVTTVVMSEFGRRVAQNGSGGLDHGLGNLMLVMGAGVAGGKVLGHWPGLASLDQGDLKVTTDFRDVLWELVRDRLGHPTPGSVFPGHTHAAVGVTA